MAQTPSGVSSEPAEHCGVEGTVLTLRHSFPTVSYPAGQCFVVLERFTTVAPAGGAGAGEGAVVCAVTATMESNTFAISKTTRSIVKWFNVGCLAN